MVKPFKFQHRKILKIFVGVTLVAKYSTETRVALPVQGLCILSPLASTGIGLAHDCHPELYCTSSILNADTVDPHKHNFPDKTTDSNNTLPQMVKVYCGLLCLVCIVRWHLQFAIRSQDVLGIFQQPIHKVNQLILANLIHIFLHSGTCPGFSLPVVSRFVSFLIHFLLNF